MINKYTSAIIGSVVIILLAMYVYHPLTWLGFASPDDHWMLCFAYLVAGDLAKILFSEKSRNLSVPAYILHPNKTCTAAAPTMPPGKAHPYPTPYGCDSETHTHGY